MGHIFVILSILMLIYISTRKIDFFSIGAICFLIYHFHLAYGIVYIASHVTVSKNLYYEEIDTSLYVIIFTQIIILFLVMLNYDLKKKMLHSQIIHKSLSRRNRNSRAVHKTFVVFGYFAFVVFAIDILSFGFKNLSLDKSKVWDELGILYVFTMWAAMAVFTYAIRDKKYRLLFLSLPPVLIHLFIGSRAYFAALVIVLLILYGNRLKDTRWSNIKTYIYGAIGFFFIMIYKKIYTHVKNFDWPSIVAVFYEKDTYMWVFRLGEPRIVLANYNYIISTGFKLDFSDILARLISFIPFANRLVEPTNGLLLSDVFKRDFQSTYGLASSFWAEGYAMFGFLGLFIFYLLWVLMLQKGSELIKSNSWTKYFAIPIISYFTFYIHRMDFTKVIGNIKYLLFAMVVWWIINAILTNNTKIKRKISVPVFKRINKPETSSS